MTIFLNFWGEYILWQAVIISSDQYEVNIMILHVF